MLEVLTQHLQEQGFNAQFWQKKAYCIHIICEDNISWVTIEDNVVNVSSHNMDLVKLDISHPEFLEQLVEAIPR